MLAIRKNFDLLFQFLIKRYIGDHTFKENKHYEYVVRQIKTELNNYSYIIKQTTGVPKEIRNLRSSNSDLPFTLAPQPFYNPPLSKHSKLKISKDNPNKFLGKNALIQDRVKEMVTHYSTTENNNYIDGEVKNSCSTNDTPKCYNKTNEGSDKIFFNHNNGNNCSKSHNQHLDLYSYRANETGNSCLDVPISDDSNQLSLYIIKELLVNKLKDIAIADFNPKDVFSDKAVILNQKIPERESLIFFKHKHLHFIQSSHTNFKNEVKNYLKKLDNERRNRSATDRLNVIKFSKLDNFFNEPDFSLNPAAILKVKNSLPLAAGFANKTWIQYIDDCDNVESISRNNIEQESSQNYIEFSTKSGPPFTEKVPIKRDKLIEENVVPNTSILSIINSIDKSAVIIQKDLYITDQIIQKINKEEEEEKHKEMDKDKLETSAKEDCIMYLGAPFVKNGMVTLSLAGLIASKNKESSNDMLEVLVSNKQALFGSKSLTKEKHESLQLQTLSIYRNGLSSQTTSNKFNNVKHYDSSACVTLKNIDNEGKISLNMLYEPSKVVPLFSFLSKNENGKSKNDNTEKCMLSNETSGEKPQLQSSGIYNDNNTMNRISVHKARSADGGTSLDCCTNKLQGNNYHPSTPRKNRLQLLENKSSQRRTITNKCEKKNSNTLKHTIQENKQWKNLLKDHISLTKKTNSQDDNYKLLLINNERLEQVENELSKLKKLTSASEKNPSTPKRKPCYTTNKSGIIKSLENFSKKYNPNKELSVSNGLKNESEKTKSETTENLNNIAEHVVQAVKESLETWLKSNNPVKGISCSDGLKKKPENKCSETSFEEISHLTQNIESDIVKSEETLTNDYLSKSVSDENSSDKVMMDHNENSNITQSNYNNYEPSNTTSSEPEVTENHSPIQDGITPESERNFLENTEEEPIQTVDQASMKETFASNINYPVEDRESFFDSNGSETNQDINVLQSKDKTLDKKLCKDSNQVPGNKCQYNPQLYSFECSNETCESVINEEDGPNMELSDYNTQASPTKEGSYKKAAIVSYINSSDKVRDIEIPHSNIHITPRNESSQPVLTNSDNLVQELSSRISDKSGEGSFNEKKNVKMNDFFPVKKKFESYGSDHSYIDRIKKTTISAVEQKNFTDINVSEVETYVDSRIPIPFSTETFYQIFGTNHSLRDYSSFIDITKQKLTSSNTITDQQINPNVMAKLNDIHKSVQHLNIISLKSKSLQNKDTVLKNEALIPPRKVSKSPVKGTEKVQESMKERQHSKTPIDTVQTVNEEYLPNFLPKFSIKIFKNNNLTVKPDNLKQMKNLNLENLNNKPDFKKQDKTLSMKDEKSLLVVGLKNENINEIKVDQMKRGIQKAELTGIKVSRGKYVDLFSFNKREKKAHDHKKGVYDHRGLSKRDRKILRAITKEIPKKKYKRKSGRKRPIKPITSGKAGKAMEQPIKSLTEKSKDPGNKKHSEFADKTMSNKQILLPPGKKEVPKTFTDKIENTSHKFIPAVGKKSVESKNSLKFERPPKDKKLDKTFEKNKISEQKLTKAEKYTISKLGKLKQVTKSEKKVIKNTEPRNSINDESNTEKNGKKPLCQTYVATETYINQPEKTHMIPEKIFTNKKILKKNQTQTPQKVTILENSKANQEDSSETFKIYEGFKDDLIKKSQKKIEHRSNIDFRVKSSKIKNPRSKVATSKSKIKGKVISEIMLDTMSKAKKDQIDIKNKHLSHNKTLSNKFDQSSSSMETSVSKQTSTKQMIAPVQNMKNELHKVNQPTLKSKETYPQPLSKIMETRNKHKHLERTAKEPEKQQESERQKIVSTDQLKSMKEPQIGMKTGLSENINKKQFPMFLIDVDKMSKEIKPELDFKNCHKCQIALEKITDFPLHNQKKKLLFKPPFKILNLGPSNDPTLKNELKYFPSVTKVLNSTIPEHSRQVLREWRKNMINELGENGFKSFYRGQLINGNKFNWELQNFLVTGENNKQEFNNLSLKSIRNVLNHTSDLTAINSHVIHKKLAYRGVIDCVAKYQNKPVLIEWKRLENSRVEIANSSIDLAATQLSAYVGALNHDDSYKFQISGGLIVLAFNDGSEAEVIEINNEQCDKQWRVWLKRLQSYHELSRNKAK